ncbi:MAG: hypothetical protein ABI091_26815 [Ferruginibacter sp.]
MPTYPVNTFPNFSQLEAYINNFWTQNGIQEITGIIGNDVVNALLTFIEQSPLNWQTARIESGGGIIVASRPVVVFMTTTPTSLAWNDNIYNEFIFINTTPNPIPLAGGRIYYDIHLIPHSYIPANTSITIVKATNSNWVQSSGVGNSPYGALNLVVGEAGAPANGASTWQSNLLLGLGGTLARAQIMLAETPFSSYGTNKGFNLDNVGGYISLIGGVFNTGDSLYINLNQ